uniref:Uncharacterized protein n=1 Tax=Arundo donax TaxID=35708 RepID=A0A0A9CIT9_ARUDO
MAALEKDKVLKKSKVPIGPELPLKMLAQNSSIVLSRQPSIILFVVIWSSVKHKRTLGKLTRENIKP